MAKPTKSLFEPASLNYIVTLCLLVAAAFFILLFKPTKVSAYSLDWAKQFGTSDIDRARGTSVDAEGNVYSVGWTSGLLPDQTSSVGDDAFIGKYSAAGNELWTRQFSGTSHEYAWTTSVDSSGNVFVAGYTVGRFPGQTSSGGNDVFVRKYSPAGIENWTKQFGSGENDYCEGSAVDSSGNLYLSGFTYGGLPGQSASGAQDAFLRKYDQEGNELWTRQFGSGGDDFGKKVAIDSSDNVYVVGWTTDALPDQASSGNYDAYVRKYDGNGNELWTRQFGTSDADYSYAVSADSNTGIYVAGHTRGSLPGQSAVGGQDAYVRKYDTDGNQIWTRQFGSARSEWVWNSTADLLGNVFVAGYTAGTLPGQASLGSNDAFVRQYDRNGNELWTEQFGSPADDRAWAITADSTGNVYITGDTTGAFPGQTSFGDVDVFLAKYAGGEVIPPSLELAVSPIDLQTVSAGSNTWPGADSKNKPTIINSTVAWRLFVYAQTDFSGGGQMLPSANLKMGPSYAQTAEITTTSSIQVASGLAGNNLKPNLYTTLEIPWSAGLVNATLSSTLTYTVLPQ